MIFTSTGYERSPKTFTIVASNEGRTDANWTSLYHVNDAGFKPGSQAQFKSWQIPAHAQKPFLCYGIHIDDIMVVKEDSKPIVARMMMWEVGNN